MATQKRKDSKGRNLKENEFQRSDGQYMFRYYDAYGSMLFLIVSFRPCFVQSCLFHFYKKWHKIMSENVWYIKAKEK